MIGNLLCILLGAALHWGWGEFKWRYDFKKYIAQLRDKFGDELDADEYKAGGTSSDD